MKELIKKRLEEVAKQKEQTVAQINAVLGAEQELTRLLEEFENATDNN